MPPTERKKLRRELSNLLFHSACFDLADGCDGQSATTTELLELYGGLVACRYLNPRYKIRRPPGDPYRVFGLRENEFFSTVRVTKSTFDFILDLIKHHPVFHNNSYHEQRPVAVQLAVTLEWYGGHGNGNSVGRVSRENGIGAGTLSTYVRRVQRALLQHYRRYVKWPSTTRRITSSAYHRERFGLPGVVGMVDGSHVIFDQKPGIDGSIHFNRKSRYSFNVQVVSDEDKRILFVYTGWPGSCNDTSIFAKSPIMLKPQDYFSGDEYLIGDSGYAISERVIVPFKRPAALLPENIVFNETLCSARVLNENTIGLWKNRWMSLKGIRTQLNNDEDFVQVNNHILACAMLHNIALMRNDPWLDDSNDDDDEELNQMQEPRAVDREDDTRAGNAKRERLKLGLFA